VNTIHSNGVATGMTPKHARPTDMLPFMTQHAHTLAAGERGPAVHRVLTVV